MSAEPPRRRWLAAPLFALALAFAVVLVAVAYTLFEEFNPWFDRTADFREVKQLMTDCRSRPLDAGEFGRCLALFDSRQQIVQTYALAVAAVAVHNTPEYRDDYHAALTRLTAHRNPAMAGAATRALRRLAVKEAAPALLGGAGAAGPW